MKRVIRPAQAPKPVGPYNHAVQVGSLIFCSGQIPIEPSTGEIVAGDIRSQTARAIENLEIVLGSEGLTLESVVKTTVFLTDLGEFPAMNEVYARYFPTDPPARSTVQVAALPKQARVEIEAIAAAKVA